MKIRCSSIGKIMTSPKTKGEVLSQTSKTYIQGLALAHVYNIRKEFTSKYTDKGNECEDMCIGFVMEVLDKGFLFKNHEHYSNEWLTGTPDIITDDLVIDVKNSWSGSTFPWFETECPNKEYFFQLQGYMFLCDKQEALLCYCLTNTPHAIVEQEVKSAHYKLGLMEESLDLRDEVQKQHSFDHIPDAKRVKVFTIKRDEEVIEQIKIRVEQCREYFNQLIEQL
jgi:hypothetical protein